MNFNKGYFQALNFIRSVDLMYTKQLEMFFTNSGYTKLQKDNIMKMLIKNKELFTDEKGLFCSAKSDFKISDFSTKLEKTIWFYVHNLDTFSFANFNPKLPAGAYMCGSVDDNYQELTVFYIPTGQEKMESRIIETNYGGMPSRIPTAIICSENCAIEDITLSDIFDIKMFAMIDSEGNIKLLK